MSKATGPVLNKSGSIKKPVVYVSNLPFEAPESIIRDAFWEGASIDPENVEVLLKALPTGRARGCGLCVVTLRHETEIPLCLEKLDGYNVLGRPMIVRLDKFMADDPNYEHEQPEHEPALDYIKQRS